MSNIKIHGQKIQFHKKVAISVTLTAGTGGTATFAPATGTSYALNSLPIGTRIVKSTDTLYSLSDANGNGVGTITLAASSGYNVDEVSRTRGGVKTTIGIVPIILQEGDSIAADFEATTMRLKFYNGGLGTFYNNITGQSIPDGYYADVPRADVLRFNPSGTNDGAIEIFKDGLWTPTIIYMYSGQQAYIFAESSGGGQSQTKEFAPEPGYTYEFPTLWNLPSGYQYLDGSTFAFQNSPAPTCDLVDYQTAGITSPYALDNDIINTVRNTISAIQQIDNRMMPNDFNYVLIDQDGYYGFCKYNCMYRTIDPQSGSAQYVNSQIYVAFYKHSNYLVAMPYECVQASQYQIMPLWVETHLPTPDNYINPVFDNGDEYGLNNWMADWNCRSICDFTNLIKDLAEYNI